MLVILALGPYAVLSSTCDPATALHGFSFVMFGHDDDGHDDDGGGGDDDDVDDDDDDDDVDADDD
eukprot:11341152-Karenia_brevis.AAC.1